MLKPKQTETIHVAIAHIETITPTVKRFTLTSPTGEPLPRFTGGSHILVHKLDQNTARSNAYSLINSPSESDRYQIAVQRATPSHGGSVYMHTQLATGDILEISPPQNLFALSQIARKHILIAGGIGITPFLSQMDELSTKQADYTLHYAFRNKGAFVEELSHSIHHPHTHFYSAEQGQRLDIDAILANWTIQTHIYVCGPQTLIDAVRDHAAQRAIAQSAIHIEQFAVPADKHNDTFTVTLQRSGKQLHVPSGVSILDIVEKAGIANVSSLCRSGVCGTCETAIIEGAAKHFDQYLSEEEKEAQKTMMICVSRAQTAKLVLDL